MKNTRMFICWTPSAMAAPAVTAENSSVIANSPYVLRSVLLALTPRDC